MQSYCKTFRVIQTQTNSQMVGKPTAEEYKEMGNAAVEEERYTEAILYYTHAIKLDPKNAVLFSNRSFALFKTQQFYYAMLDAIETIKLDPQWYKGYFRKGEVEFATSHFVDACDSYEIALTLQPGDATLLEVVSKANKERVRDMKADEQIPWLGAGIGIVFNAIVVITNYFQSNIPTEPLLTTISTLVFALSGFIAAKVLRDYVKDKRDNLLEIREFDGFVVTDDVPKKIQGACSNKNKSNGSASRCRKNQSRQRCKRGK